MDGGSVLISGNHALSSESLSAFGTDMLVALPVLLSTRTALTHKAYMLAEVYECAP